MNKQTKDNKLNISDKTVKTKCPKCHVQFTEELWCKKCDPCKIIEGWTSGNSDIDKFIKETIYSVKYNYYYYSYHEWVPFSRFTNIKEIGEGGFSKVYSATWIDGKSCYGKEVDGSWKKLDSEPMKVALKRLNGSQNMTAKYSNELKMYWEFCGKGIGSSNFYGMTKDPKTEEFIMILDFANKGNLRSTLSNDFNNILWKDKIDMLLQLVNDLENLFKLGYSHKNFHSGNILRNNCLTYISDFVSFGPTNDEQKSHDKIYGVLPYIAPEVLNGEPCTVSSNIYNFGVIMTELSSGKPPFHNRKHDLSLALDVCNGLRPEFGKGTPDIYKKLAHRCMNVNINKRPKSNELDDILRFWCNSINGSHQEVEVFGYKGKGIMAVFEEADKEIPKISTSYEKNPDAVYTSRAFTFSNLPKPINSSLITQYLEEDEDIVL